MKKIDKNLIINTLLVLLLGIILGIFSKWLDNLSINDEIWWQHIIGILDLRNVFSNLGIWLLIGLIISLSARSNITACINVFLFFIGMTTSYHIYTILFSAFNPIKYMMIWYVITIISPILASICWHAKRNNKISIIIKSMIIFIMAKISFSVGFWYIYPKSIIDTLIFISTLITLYISTKKEKSNEHLTN